MIDDANTINVPFDPPDPDLTYRNCLRTREMLGVTPVPREQALGLIAECGEALAGYPEPTQH